MWTVDDKVFCILHACKDTLGSQRLIPYLYIYQLLGVDFEFRYKITPNGIKSRGIDYALSDLINSAKINITDGVLSLSSLGEIYYYNVALTAEEWDLINDTKATLDKLSDDELNFVVLTDIMVNDARKDGVTGLIQNKDRIIRALTNLSKEYSDENFNSALALTKLVREGNI